MQRSSIVLITISIIGAIGLPLGDPKFITTAIGLELAYITLAVLSFKNIRYVPIASIVLAIIVIIGNTASKTHIDIMLSLDPIENAIILIIGGYALQGLLIITSIFDYKYKEEIRWKRRI
ncbi:MAG: hypothetical protein KatS3mg003_0132 [Candidatus Nitrosocaldaceae archaeon]|nr:MAG: hypothetical protein KatS3mg003_0132 [Candidatus Nitrosocaldaceae archaeon]